MPKTRTKRETDLAPPASSAAQKPARVSLESCAQMPSPARIQPAARPSASPSPSHLVENCVLQPDLSQSSVAATAAVFAASSSLAQSSRRNAKIGAERKRRPIPKSDPDNSSDGNEDDVPPSQYSLNLTQIPLSQADEQIQRLDKQGQLTEVVGSQSMLSQELLYSSQRDEQPLSENEEGEDNTQDYFPQTESSLSMAQRFGLLGRDDEVGLRSAANLSTPTKKLQAGLESALSSPHGFAFGESQLSHVSLDEAAAAESLQMVSASSPSQTSVRERGNECFGSLLDAVKIITDQEGVDPHLYEIGDGKLPANEKKPVLLNSTPGRAAKPKIAPKRKSPPPSVRAELPAAEKPTKKPRKSHTRKKDEEYQKAQETAKRAAALAEQTVADPEMAKRLLLSMALVRENPRTAPSSWPAKGSVVKEGFFWAHYPPLEAVLKEHMKTYYELSTTKCQSAQQQKFNNDLVVLIRDVAKEQEWKFDSCFNDKALRDRVRCYFKTHIQNAKKRLRTMVRNPTKKANARHLCAHLDLIEEHNNMAPEENAANSDAPGGPNSAPVVSAAATPADKPKRVASNDAAKGCESDSTLSDTEVRQIIARKKRHVEAVAI